jgi:hypothetical protein
MAAIQAGGFVTLDAAVTPAEAAAFWTGTGVRSVLLVFHGLSR